MPLNLAVGLKIESDREPPFDTQEVAQKEPELRYKYWATVADIEIGQTVM